MKKKHFPLKRNWLYCNELGRWTSALIVSLSILLVVFLFKHPVFMTIDDARLKYIYAGYSTGEPVSVYLFSYYPLSLILSSLYKAFPYFPWYAFYQFGVIGLGTALIGKTIYRIFYKKNIPFLYAIILHVLLYLSLALISTILMHFEITATVIATAGAILLMNIDFKNDHIFCKIVDMFFSLFCIAASFTIQYNAFYSICCYLLVVAVVIFIKAYKEKNLKSVSIQFFCYLFCFAFLIGGVKFSDNWAKSTPEWKDYLEYNKYRVSFWDYPHMTYQEDPELFESIGWSEEFYNSTKSMYFMDRRFNKETLSQFVDRFSWLDFDSFHTMLSTMKSTLSFLLHDERIALIQTIILVLLGFLVLFLCFSKKNWQKYYPELISLLCCLSGTVVLTLFLASRGRLPLRAFLAFSIPSISVIVFLLLRMIPDYQQLFTQQALLKKFYLAGFLSAFWLVGMFWSYDQIINDEWEWRANYNTEILIMEQYVAAHPENIYVYDRIGAQNYSVFSSYPEPEQRPSNAFVCGSSYLFTPAYQEQLEKNGLEQLYTENLFDENVYYIAYSKGSSFDSLIEMIHSDYGYCFVRPIERISNTFTVYKFIRGPYLRSAK